MCTGGFGGGFHLKYPLPREKFSIKKYARCVVYWGRELSHKVLRVLLCNLERIG